jgi:hypothetical protein
VSAPLQAVVNGALRYSILTFSFSTNPDSALSACERPQQICGIFERACAHKADDEQGRVLCIRRKRSCDCTPNQRDEFALPFCLTQAQDRAVNGLTLSRQQWLRHWQGWMAGRRRTWVIRDRVEPAASPAMSAIPRKRKQCPRPSWSPCLIPRDFRCCRWNPKETQC